MKRFIVFNAECGWIQGDIAARAPADAVTRMEGRMSTETENADWHVFEAPAGFPIHGTSYSAVDKDLVAQLRSLKPTAIISNKRLSVPPAEYAMAS